MNSDTPNPSPKINHHLRALYQKVEAFQKHLSPQVQTSLQCKKKCSQCCYTDISVFQVEADHIKSLLQSSNKIENSAAPQGACAFLKNDLCTIYEARPLICRTQGLPLYFAEANKQIDICPLNIEALTQTKTSDILNLDLLNSILSQIELADAGGQNRDRAALKDLHSEYFRS